jgi:hypothetical protein
MVCEETTPQSIVLQCYFGIDLLVTNRSSLFVPAPARATPWRLGRGTRRHAIRLSREAVRWRETSRAERCGGPTLRGGLRSSRRGSATGLRARAPPRPARKTPALLGFIEDMEAAAVKNELERTPWGEAARKSKVAKRQPRRRPSNLAFARSTASGAISMPSTSKPRSASQSEFRLFVPECRHRD